MNVEKFITDFGGITETYSFYNGEVELRYDVENHEYLLVQDGKLIPTPGVTTICHIIDKSNALVPWAAKMVVEKLKRLLEPEPSPTTERMEQLLLEAKSAPRDKVEEAADIGKIAHNWIEEYIKRVIIGIHDAEYVEPLPDNPKSASCVQAAIAWMYKHKVEWVATETKIYSRKSHFAGTLDGLAYVSSCDDILCCPTPFEKRLSIIDWKSSNYLYNEYLLQTAAYEYAYEEEHGVNIEDRWIIRLGKENGEFEPWHLGPETFETDIKAFLTALELYSTMNEIQDRMKQKKDFIKNELKARKKAAKEAEKIQAKADKARAKKIKKDVDKL